MRRKTPSNAQILLATSVAFCAISFGICNVQRWKFEFGNPKAKVKIEAFYPVGSPDHKWVIDYIKEIVKTFPNKVYAIAIDWTTPEGAKEFEKRKLSCGIFFINGKRRFTINGNEVEFTKTPLLGGWTKEQLMKAVAMEVQKAYGATKQQPKPQKTPQPKKPSVLKVFVPCGVAGPYVDIKRLFEGKNPDIKLEDKIENVLVLAKRIESGETPDIYITVGKKEVERFAKKRGIKPGDIFKVAKSSLSLIVPKGNPAGIKTLNDLASKKVRSFAIARVETSIGYCSQQALKKLGIWEKIRGKVVYAKFPAELKGWTQQRRVDAAIVYHPCLYEAQEIGQRPKFAEGVELITVIPSKLHDEIPVLAIVMPNSSNRELANKFVQFMLTEEAQKAFKEWKFEPIAVK